LGADTAGDGTELERAGGLDGVGEARLGGHGKGSLGLGKVGGADHSAARPARSVAGSASLRRTSACARASRGKPRTRAAETRWASAGPSAKTSSRPCSASGVLTAARGSKPSQLRSGRATPTATAIAAFADMLKTEKNS